MLANDANITAWFEDAATRHPEILHNPATEAGKRFFELEWDEMVQNAKQLSNTGWYLILEDYREEFQDNNADYISQTPTITFWVIRNVKPGDRADKKQAYQDARRIARSIWSKLARDTHNYLAECDADVPDGVSLPADVLLGTLVVDRLQHPMFPSSFGVRCMLKIRTNHEESLDEETEWVPLP